MRAVTTMADSVVKSDRSKKSDLNSTDPEMKDGPKKNTQSKGQTLRLNMEAWRQLRYLATDQDRSAHDLLIEAVNDFFVKHGKPPIA